MLNTNRLAAILLGTLIASVPAVSQEGGKSEVSVQAFGSFVKGTNSNGVDQNATNSGGVLASYRFFLTDNHGIEVNYGYSLNTQSYGLPTGLEGVKANQHEVTAAYVYRHRWHGFTPFAEAGVGALVFDPTGTPTASTETRAAFLYGAGADFKLTKRAFLRAEYRGLVYNSPTFGFGPVLGFDRTTHRAEPSIGFGYRF